MPWRKSFGAPLTLLRHQRNDAARKELARVYVRDALRRWVPGAKLLGLEVLQGWPELTLLVRVSEGGTVATVDTNIRP